MQSSDFQWNTLLNKIKLITESMDAGHGVSLLERDLLLHYIRQFYEATSELKIAEDLPNVKKKEPTPEPKQAAPIKPEPVKKEEKKEEPIEKIEFFVKKPEDTPPPKEVVVEVVEPVIIVPEKEEIIIAEPKPEPKIEVSEKPIEPILPKKEEGYIELGNEIKNHPIFDGVDKNEIGLRFSEMPISDLRKAMGFNERLTAVKFLFNGSESLLEETLEKLNSFSNFEETKSTIVKLAHRYDWLSEPKDKAAKAFVKLVFRRYKG